jgi:hypothetical protein
MKEHLHAPWLEAKGTSRFSMVQAFHVAQPEEASLSGAEGRKTDGHQLSFLNASIQ